MGESDFKIFVNQRIYCERPNIYVDLMCYCRMCGAVYGMVNTVGQMTGLLLPLTVGWMTTNVRL